MSHCKVFDDNPVKVFDPVSEIEMLKRRVEQLERQLTNLTKRVQEGSPVYGPGSPTWAIGGWFPDSFPKSYDGWHTNITLANNKENE